ncbi:hypothetical protein C8R46DRAFT_900956 [Mycena filopes]|nr:hypothetical protein C8R46DRAFT_900956 [Mycena filopes]
MLTATGAAISGSTVATLMSGCMFTPEDLDFVVGIGLGIHVVDYLVIGANYVLSTDSSGYHNLNGVHRVWTLMLGSLKINVIESLSRNPLDVISFFHMTCVHGAWLANGLWHGYPGLTAHGLAITTPARFPIPSGVEGKLKVWQVVRKYTARGYRILLGEYAEPHDCGDHFNCPVTLRISDDEGCSYSPFPHWTYSVDAVVHGPTVWSMAGTGCRHGILSRGSSRLWAACASSSTSILLAFFCLAY